MTSGHNDMIWTRNEIKKLTDVLVIDGHEEIADTSKSKKC